MTSVATMSTGSGMDKYYSSKIGELNSVSGDLAWFGINALNIAYVEVQNLITIIFFMFHPTILFIYLYPY